MPSYPTTSRSLRHMARGMVPVAVILLASGCGDQDTVQDQAAIFAPPAPASGLVSSERGAPVALETRVLVGAEQLVDARRSFIRDMESARAQGGQASTVVILGPDNERFEGHWSEVFTDDLLFIRPELLERP